MALNLDENYNGTTMLNTWWQKIKNNFASVKIFVDALETDKANAADVEKALAYKADKTELHAHGNKSILDGITQDTVNDWQKVADAVDDLRKEMSGEYESGLGDRIDKLEREKAAKSDVTAETKTLSDKIGNLDNLPTADKTSIVNAIIALKKLIGNGSGAVGDSIYAMSDYSVAYSEEGDNTNAYVSSQPDDVPLGVYIYSPEREIDNVFFVGDDGESELAVYSGKLYPGYTYMLKFGSDSSSKLAEFGGSGIDVSEIDEALSVINEDITALQKDIAALKAVCVDGNEVAY